MHDVLRSKKIQIPSQKFHNNIINFEKPQNFQQKKNTKKLGQMHEMHENEGL